MHQHLLCLPANAQPPSQALHWLEVFGAIWCKRPFMDTSIHGGPGTFVNVSSLGAVRSHGRDTPPHLRAAGDPEI